MSAAHDVYAYTAPAQLAQRIAELEHDCLVMALRLCGESPLTFAPETAAVMDKWRPRCEEELGTAEPRICATCNGSGEGLHDGTRCHDCHGWGIEREREAA